MPDVLGRNICRKNGLFKALVVTAAGAAVTVSGCPVAFRVAYVVVLSGAGSRQAGGTVSGSVARPPYLLLDPSLPCRVLRHT